MQVKQTYKYTQDVDTIYACYTDSAFVKAKVEALGSRNVNVEVNAGSGDTVIVKITREVPAEVPQVLKKFIKPWNKLAQTDVWNGSAGGPYRCNIQFESDGAPISIEANWKLTATNLGCMKEVTININANVPLIGGRLAKFAANASTRALQREHEYISQNA